MASSFITLVLLGCLLLWLLAWQRRSQLAIGIAIGVVLGAIGAPAVGGIHHMPIWLPALPFALVALSLFGFGLLAWFWGEN